MPLLARRLRERDFDDFRFGTAMTLRSFPEFVPNRPGAPLTARLRQKQENNGPRTQTASHV